MDYIRTWEDSREKRIQSLIRRMVSLGREWSYTTIVSAIVKAMQIDHPSHPEICQFASDLNRAIDNYLERIDH